MAEKKMNLENGQKEAKGKEHDNFEVKTENKVVRAQHFIYNNSKIISYVSAGVIVILVLVLFLKNILQKNADENQQKAMVSLSRILPYYDAPDFRKALFGDSAAVIRGEKVIGLIAIVEQYKGTKQGKVAALYAGNSYLALSKAKEAIEYFEIAADSPSKIVLEGANAGLGAANELHGKNKEAVEYYQKAAEIAVTDESIARYNYYAGRNYERTGDKENAVKLYKKIIGKNKMTEFANYSKAGLVRLGMKID